MPEPIDPRHPPPLPIPYNPDQGDIVLARTVSYSDDPDDPPLILCRASIRQHIWPWPGVAMKWGEDLPSLISLAVNVLHVTLDQGRPVRCEDWEFPLACSPAAWRASWAFCWQVLRSTPFWGRTLKGKSIRTWAQRIGPDGWIVDRYTGLCIAAPHQLSLPRPG